MPLLVCFLSDHTQSLALCAGLTQNGVQRPPKWLTDFLGVKNPDPVTGSKTLEDLFEKAE